MVHVKARSVKQLDNYSYVDPKVTPLYIENLLLVHRMDRNKIKIWNIFTVCNGQIHLQSGANGVISLQSESLSLS